jgi:gamma-glutamylcysteine synthetase
MLKKCFLTNIFYFLLPPQYLRNTKQAITHFRNTKQALTHLRNTKQGLTQLRNIRQALTQLRNTKQALTQLRNTKQAVTHLRNTHKCLTGVDLLSSSPYCYMIKTSFGFVRLQSFDEACMGAEYLIVEGYGEDFYG